MIDITFLGQLVATLASTTAFLAFLGVLGASSYVLSTAALAIEHSRAPMVVPRPTTRQTGFPWTLGTIAGLLLFVTSLATFRVGGGLATLVFSIALGALARSSVALVGVLGARVGLRLAQGREARAKALIEWRLQKAAELQESNRKRMLGDDLMADVAQADAAVAKLREALGTLVQTRATVADKLKAALDEGGNVSLVADLVRMRDDMDARIDLGQRVLRAAEMAVARLAFGVPVKKIVRRRPMEISGLDPKLPGPYASRIDAAISAIDAFLVIIGQTREEIGIMERQRPVVDVAEGTESFPARARREIDAIASAYRAVRERAELVRLSLRAKDGMAQVVSAAGELSMRADGPPDEREVHLLLDDIARAHQTNATDFLGDDEHVKALATALAQGAKALSGGDRASLGEVVDALQSMG